MLRTRASLVSAAALAVAAATVLGTAPAAADTAPGAAGLNPPLAEAYSAAYRQATAEGVPLRVTSGLRSWAQQESLWQQGVAQYGSPAAARRWVLPPAESTHVSGDAVDVGPWRGAAWLQRNGNRWGLCRTFDNEWWHFEVATAPGAACPATVPDASMR
ncbi:M15 family metallopeptidase [Tsukamurella sp. 1534]|uniref:M15 family metallopeptidase n=1 Tax=Tsukamurella sp. 1534 TaxID=1151061 RepID=UPI0002DBE3A6|nr:M15 family metallopeptidase [Tsukamurella sp. 1534]